MLVSTILENMSKFKSNPKKSFNNSSTNHLMSKEAQIALTFEAKLNWNKIPKGVEAKILKGKYQITKTSTHPNKPPNTQHNVMKS